MAERLARIDRHRAQRDAGLGQRQPLDEETLRQLRQLGYID